MTAKKVLALSGGVGGAKLARGLDLALAQDSVNTPNALTVVCNTADDFEYLGFPISPDLDTVMYTLAGLNNQQQGWGLEGETWQFMQSMAQLGEPMWFRLGDKDIATHTQRRALAAQGLSLSQITARLTQALGLKAHIVPMSDQGVSTCVLTDEGRLGFQEYFVKRQCEPKVTGGFEFDGLDQASPSPDFIKALTQELSAIIICPSNPFVSVDPIIKLAGVKALMQSNTAPVVAVSPIISGQAVKGPAAKMLAELNLPVTALAVAQYYAQWIDVFVLDRADQALQGAIEDLGLKVLIADTLMQNDADKQRLASEILQFVAHITPPSVGG